MVFLFTGYSPKVKIPVAGDPDADFIAVHHGQGSIWGFNAGSICDLPCDFPAVGVFRENAETEAAFRMAFVQEYAAKRFNFDLADRNGFSAGQVRDSLNPTGSGFLRGLDHRNDQFGIRKARRFRTDNNIICASGGTDNQQQLSVEKTAAA